MTIIQSLIAGYGNAAPPPSGFATWNPSDKSTDYTLSNADLTVTHSALGNWSALRANMGKSSGKWYWEYTCDLLDVTTYLLGVGNSSMSLLSYVGSDVNGWGYQDIGLKYNSAGAAYGVQYFQSNVIGVALDMDAGTLEMFVNGVSQGVMYSGLTGTIYPAASLFKQGNQMTANFGATAFAYTVPAGFNAGLY